MYVKVHNTPRSCPLLPLPQLVFRRESGRNYTLRRRHRGWANGRRRYTAQTGGRGRRSHSFLKWWRPDSARRAQGDSGNKKWKDVNYPNCTHKRLHVALIQSCFSLGVRWKSGPRIPESKRPPLTRGSWNNWICFSYFIDVNASTFLFFLNWDHLW